jgi:hypothetical protein
MRHVGEQRAEGDHHLDAEIPREIDDHPREGLPAEVRLDAEQEDYVPVEAGNRRMVEGVLRPLDVAGLPLDERNVRAGCLEVVEVLGLDLREAVRLPDLGEVAARQRRALAPIVPAAECGDQNRLAQIRPVGDAKFVSDARSLRSV